MVLFEGCLGRLPKLHTFCRCERLFRAFSALPGGRSFANMGLVVVVIGEAVRAMLDIGPSSACSTD